MPSSIGFLFKKTANIDYKCYALFINICKAPIWLWFYYLKIEMIVLIFIYDYQQYCVNL